MAVTTTPRLEEILYTGPDTIGGHYMRTFWHPVYRARDLVRGQAVPIKILGEPLTLYRGEGGAPHLTAFRCAHRGTQLSVGWVEGDRIRCRYHGWMYDDSGQCVEQPGEEVDFASRVRIRVYPVQEYLGLIFTYLGEAEPPLIRRYPDFEQPGLLEVDPPEPWPCNFWNRLDNDPAHLPWTHRVSMSHTNEAPRPVGADHSKYVETDYGISDSRPGGGRNIFYLPNLNQLRTAVKIPGYERMLEYRLVWHVPVDDQNTISFDLNVIPGLVGEEAERFRERRELHEGAGSVPYQMAKSVLAGGMRIEDMDPRLPIYEQFWIEDYATQVGQGPMPDFANERLGKNDVKVILRRQIFQREMHALAEGRPRKQWSSPALYADDHK
jgi:5,5'-dehydrodivanillate O-demethylase